MIRLVTDCTSLVPAYLGLPGLRAVKRVCFVVVSCNCSSFSCPIPVQVIDWKDSSLKQLIMCHTHTHTLNHAHSLSLSVLTATFRVNLG